MAEPAAVSLNNDTCSNNEAGITDGTKQNIKKAFFAVTSSLANELSDTLFDSGLCVGDALTPVPPITGLLTSSVNEHHHMVLLAAHSYTKMEKKRRQCTQRKHRPHHAGLHIHENVLNDVKFADAEFKQYFRIAKSTYEYLLQKMGATLRAVTISSLSDEKAQTFSPEIQLLLTLWTLGNREGVDRVAGRFQMTPATVQCLSRKVHQKIYDKLVPMYITWPTQVEQLVVERRLHALYGVTNVIGVLGMTRIAFRMQSPGEGSGMAGQSSVALQAIVREDGRFIDLFCNLSEKSGNRATFRSSRLSQRGKGLCGGRCLLSKVAYSRDNWIVPQSGKTNATVGTNGSKRNCITNTIDAAFQCLRQRFRRLQCVYVGTKTLHELRVLVTNACVLHNICILNDDAFDHAL